MEKEDKELLQQDLCARLPYGVYVNYKNVENKEGIIMLNPYNIQHIYSGWWKKYKPYLRPMSSMTEEEKNYINYKWDADEYGNMMAFSSYEGGISEIELADIVGFQDWLNKNMFDYRGLIPQNLAIEITEENNPYKN